MDRDPVTIQSSDSQAKLIFANFHSQTQRCYAGECEVTIEDVGLRATIQVCVHPDEFIHLFDKLAKDWRGWDGNRIAESQVRAFYMECTADRLGHVFLKVRLRSPNYENFDAFVEDGGGRGKLKYLWSAEARLRLDAGQLDEIAWNLRRFFGSSQP
jgi:hypothetical protein